MDKALNMKDKTQEIRKLMDIVSSGGKAINEGSNNWDIEEYAKHEIGLKIDSLIYAIQKEDYVNDDDKLNNQKELLKHAKNMMKAFKDFNRVAKKETVELWIHD